MSQSKLLPYKVPGRLHIIADAPTGRFRLIKLSACLEICDISESTFLRLVEAGIMPQPMKVGRIRRWVESDVIAAVKRLTSPGVKSETTR